FRRFGPEFNYCEVYDMLLLTFRDILPKIFSPVFFHISYPTHTRVLSRADATMLLPDGLSYGQAAPIFCAGYTVWSGLRWADPKPHERIVVVGIGGLGHLALQYSK